MAERVTRRFTDDDVELADLSSGGKTVIMDEVHDHRRWAVRHRVVFLADDGLFYELFYDSAATEMQEIEDEWESCRSTDGGIIGWQVRPIQVTTVKFVAVEQ